MDFFEHTDKTIERGKPTALGRVEVKGESFVVFLFVCVLCVCVYACVCACLTSNGKLANHLDSSFLLICQPCSSP